MYPLAIIGLGVWILSALSLRGRQLTDVGNTVPGHSTEEAGQASIAVRPPWCDC